KHVPAPNLDVEAPLQMLVTTLDYSDYVGRIAIGRVMAGSIRKGQTVAVMGRNGVVNKGKILQLLQFEGLGRREVNQVDAGDVCAISGIAQIDIGDTIADPENPVALPTI